MGPMFSREPSLTLLDFLSGHEEGPGGSDMCPLQISSHFPPSVPVWPLRPEHQLRESKPPKSARHLLEEWLPFVSHYNRSVLTVTGNRK